MSRPASEVLTNRESQIMEILWNIGSGTADAVREQLPDRPHDSTVRTLLRVLKQKGYVQVHGRQPVVYVPLVTREVVQHKAASCLLDMFFGGSANALVARLLEDEQLTPQQLEELKSRYATKRRKGARK